MAAKKKKDPRDELLEGAASPFKVEQFRDRKVEHWSADELQKRMDLVSPKVPLQRRRHRAILDKGL